MRRQLCWEPSLLGTQPRVQRGHCSPPTLGLGAARLGLALSDACRSWCQALDHPSASSRDQAEAHWAPVGSPGHRNTHPDNAAVVQGWSPRCLVHVSGISADRGERGLLFQVQQVPGGDHYGGAVRRVSGRGASCLLASPGPSWSLLGCLGPDPSPGMASPSPITHSPTVVPPKAAGHPPTT